MKISIPILALLLSLLYNTHAQTTCGNYTLKLYSHWDGWSDNALAVKINNQVVYPNITFNSGHGPYIFSFPVRTDDVISVLFKRNGTWADDCRYEVYDNNNNLLAVRDGAGTGSAGGPENTYGLLACPSGNYCGVYVVELFDGYGNSGWGGASLDVYINNVLTTSGTHQDLSYAWADAEDISFAVTGGDTIDLIYNTAPNLPTSFYYYGDMYKVFDESGNLLTTKVSPLVNNDPNTAGPIPNTLRLISCPGFVPNPPVQPLYDPYDFAQKGVAAYVPAAQGLTVYPSPATDVLLIQCSENLTHYSIVNKLGMPLQSGVVSGKSINLQQLPADVYYLHLQTANQQTYRQMIKVVR